MADNGVNPYAYSLMGPNQPGSGTPAMQTVDPNELVGNQLNQTLDENGRYIQSARAQGVQQAASRGLMNGSISAGASENAAIQAALPIAQANAAEYANVGNANQAAQNTWLGQQIQKQTTLGAANISANASTYNADLSYKASMNQLDAQKDEFTRQLMQNNDQFGKQLAQNNDQFTKNLSTNIGEYQNQMSFNQYQLGIQMQASSQNAYAQTFAAIMNNPNMTATDRAAALQNSKDFYGQMSQYNASIPAFMPYYASNSNYWSTDWLNAA